MHKFWFSDAFVLYLLYSLGLSIGWQRLWSDCADAERSLHWLHVPENAFTHGRAQIQKYVLWLQYLKACMLCKIFLLLQCSVTCGRGRQWRRVDCRSSSDLRRVLPDSFCDPNLRPVSMKLCIERNCPPNEVSFVDIISTYVCQLLCHINIQ